MPLTEVDQRMLQRARLTLDMNIANITSKIVKRNDPVVKAPTTAPAPAQTQPSSFWRALTAIPDIGTVSAITAAGVVIKKLTNPTDAKKETADITEYEHSTTSKTVRIPFQYPVIIVSDNKEGDWKEFQTRQAEPIAIYMGGKARTIELKWSYIINNETWPDNFVNVQTWDARTISTIVKLLRGQFYTSALSGLIVRFWAYDIIGPNTGMSYTFRMDSLKISHSDTMVCSDMSIEDQKIQIMVAGSPGEAQVPIKTFYTYPLRTDIAATLKFYVNSMPKDENVFGESYKPGAGEKLSSESAIKVIELGMPVPNEIEWF